MLFIDWLIKAVIGSDGADWLMLHCREERGLNPQSGKAQGGGMVS